jgi:hypothetical protein
MQNIRDVLSAAALSALVGAGAAPAFAGNLVTKGDFDTKASFAFQRQKSLLYLYPLAGPDSRRGLASGMAGNA